MLSDACAMNSVPEVFLDAVCSQLERKDLENLRKTTRRWESKATVHYDKRKDVDVLIHANPEGTQVAIGMLRYSHLELVSFILWPPEDSRSFFVPFTADPRYDRITKLHLGGINNGPITPTFGNLPEKVSIERFGNKVLPLLRSLAVDCELIISDVHTYHPNLTDTIFRGLRTCTQLTTISTGNHGGECPDFIKHQLSLGQVRELLLYGGENWPAYIKASVHQFLKAPNFVGLDIFASDITLDFDVVKDFVERCLKGELHHNASISGTTSFHLSRLRSIHQQNIFCIKGEHDRIERSTTVWKKQNRTLIAYTHPDSFLELKQQKIGF
uniref:F-box domain-containing protein n=1 Tax=Steinernema glaseri TaxID=37863 RepID=A0A1I7ZK84_9BILA